MPTALEGYGSRFWQAVCDSTVPGTERDRLGQWWLRADLGQTGRANSAWPTGHPGCDIATAVDEVQRWYTERALMPMFQLYSDTDPALVAELDQRSWQVLRGADVLGVDVAASLGVGGDDRFDPGAVVVTSEPSPAFIDLTANPDRIAEMMRTTDRRWFASVTAESGMPAGCGLAIRAQGSVGIFAMMTAPEARRLGIGRAVLRALLGAAHADGAEVAFLQVMTTNTAAQTLYRSLGFRGVEHYEYRVPLDKRCEKVHS